MVIRMGITVIYNAKGIGQYLAEYIRLNGEEIESSTLGLLLRKNRLRIELGVEKIHGKNKKR